MSSSRRPEKLYTPRLLSLSAELANYPYRGTFLHRAEVRSRTCGSSLILGVDCDAGGAIAAIGLQVTACAVGQSSAAVLAMAAAGKDARAFAAVHHQIECWLEKEGPLPEWPGFDALEPARAHPGRRAALMLPWKAAIEALSSTATSG
jgi:NifU-like protein involved in Fe-S cluster formation